MTGFNVINKFAQDSARIAETVLKAYFIEGKPEQILNYFSRECSSWIGWGKEELYLDYNAVFNTFTSRAGEIRPHLMTGWRTEILFCDGEHCLVLVTCNIASAPQTGYYFNEDARFTFAMHSEDGVPKIVQLHSSAAWNKIRADEVFPVEAGSRDFYKLEQQLENANLPAFTAVNTPNGLKCCLADANYPAVYINKSLYKLAGYANMTEMLNATGGDIKNMVYPADLPKVQRLMAAHTSGSPYTTNYRLLRKDGTAVWVLERGQFVATEGEDDYYICSIAPLLPDAGEFNYGTLIDYSEIENAPIPMDLYFKTALDFIEKHDEQTAMEKILKLCSSMAQISGAFINDVADDDSYTPVVAQYFNEGRRLGGLLPSKPGEVIRTFNTQGLSQCDDTALMPREYKHRLQALNIKAYLSKTIIIGGKVNYILNFVQQSAPHTWTESEKDLITQTARILALVLKNYRP